MSKNRILFSAVGDTDPVRDYYDGAMLHIVRYYRPQKVYLYLSKELMKNEKYSHLYSRAIKVLDSNIEVKIYPKAEADLLDDVYDFDKFYKIFYNIIESIRVDNDNYELLLNLSSGTPAMKSTMFMLSVALNDKNMKLIQVTTPDKKSNRDKEHIDVKDENVEEIVRCSYDEVDFGRDGMNRCIEQNLIETKKVFVLHNVKKMLAKSDYSGLNDLVEQNENILEEKTCNYVRHIYNRYIGNYDLAEQIARKIGYDDLYPIKNADTLRITEKFNVIKIKSKRGELQDWLVLIYNVIEKLYEQILLSNNIDISKFVDKGRIDKIKFKKLYNKYYNLFSDDELSKNFCDLHFIKIIEFIDENLKNDLKFFKDMKLCRNAVAHNLEFLKKEEIEKRSGIKIDKFETLVKKYMYDYKINTTTEDLTKSLNIYESVEKMILECFENEIKQIQNISDT